LTKPRFQLPELQCRVSAAELAGIQVARRAAECLSVPENRYLGRHDRVDGGGAYRP
jgi:hypothetical protein